MADQRLEFEIAVTGQPVATQRVERFRDSIGGLERVAQQANTRLSGIAGGIGNLGTVLSRTSPQLSTFAGVIGTAGSAVSGLTTALGGVGGLAAGGLIGAIGLVVARMAFAKQRTEELSRAVRTATKDLRDFIAVAQRAQQQRALTSRIATGTATDIEFQAAIRQQNARTIRLRLQAKDIEDTIKAGGVGDTERLARLKQQIAASRRQADELKASQARARQEAAAAPGLDAEERQVEREASEAEKRREAARRARARDKSSFFSRELERRQGFQEIADIGLKADLGEDLPTFGKVKQFRIGAGDRGDAIILAEERRIEIIKERQRVEQEAQALVLGGAQQVLTAVILGEEGGARARLKATGDALVAQGVQHSFQALAMAIIPGAQGNAGAMAGLAAAEIAAGKAMGAKFNAPAQSAGAGGIRPQAVPQQIPATQTVVNINGIADRRIGEQVVESMRVVKRQRGEKAIQI